MDKKLFLDFLQYSSTSTVTPIITPMKPVIHSSHSNTPAKIIKKIRIPGFQRPQSANSTIINQETRKVFQLQRYNKVLKAEEIRPWSKSTSPFHSRPASGDKIRKKVEMFEARIPTAGNIVVQDTISSFMTEQQHFITGYELEANDYRNQVAAITPTPKDCNLFATEVPSFLHKVFPKRKIKRSVTRPCSTMKQISDFPGGLDGSKSRLPSKVCYYNLKKRYYPIKYKLNYIPRHTSPYRPFLKKKSKSIQNQNISSID